MTRQIESIKVWKKEWNGRGGFGIEFRIYIGFVGRSNSGCYYMTGNPYEAKGKLENLSEEELAEARVLGTRDIGDGKKAWYTLCADDVAERRARLNQDVEKEDEDTPQKFKSTVEIMAEQRQAQREADLDDQLKGIFEEEETMSDAPNLDDTFANFFGEQGKCADCGKEIDSDREFCRGCVEKKESAESPELREAIDWMNSNPGRYPYHYCALLVDAGLAEWHEGPNNRRGVIWK